MNTATAEKSCPLCDHPGPHDCPDAEHLDLSWPADLADAHAMAPHCPALAERLAKHGRCAALVAELSRGVTLTKSCALVGRSLVPRLAWEGVLEAIATARKSSDAVQALGPRTATIDIVEDIIDGSAIGASPILTALVHDGWPAIVRGDEDRPPIAPGELRDLAALARDALLEGAIRIEDLPAWGLEITVRSRT